MSVIFTLPVLFPFAVGLNVTLIEQLAPAATVPLLLQVGAASADQREITADRQSPESERCVSCVRQSHSLSGTGGAYLLRSETKAGSAQARLWVDNCKAKRDQLRTSCRVVNNRDGGGRGRWAEDLHRSQEAHGNRAGLPGSNVPGIEGMNGLQIVISPKSAIALPGVVIFMLEIVIGAVPVLVRVMNWAPT